MEETPYISQMQEEIQKNFTDIKAESLLAIAVETGLSKDDFIIAVESLFSRAYKRDILFSTIEEDANKREFLQVHLSRDGLHDHLPEGLFYPPDNAKYRDTDASLMAANHIKNKQRERETRRFFMPFENAVFSQRIALEMEETHLLKGLDFWGIQATIPSALITPLIRLLPHAYKISGDPALMSQCLEKILGEQVKGRIMQTSLTEVSKEYFYALGKGTLGIDMVMGDYFREDSPCLEISIGPLRNSQIMDYLEGGDKVGFLNTFYGFFVPAEVEVSTKIEVSKENRHMTLYKEDGPVLGYSSVMEA
jgi:hypothetical protein